eukprot:m.198545 g.198545  ORF g.198545 m.198545 type:complete len:71 (+) comp39561_c0_seq38:343-555(+)
MLLTGISNLEAAFLSNHLINGNFQEDDPGFLEISHPLQTLESQLYLLHLRHQVSRNDDSNLFSTPKCPIR